MSPVPPDDEISVSALLAQAGQRLRDAQVPQADLDAELLLRFVLDWDRAAILSRPDRPVPAEARAGFESLVGQRAGRRPIQQLLGRASFWRHDFQVTRDVLVPRPETELLVEEALHLLRGVASPVIADIGTGSGCIALSLAAECPDAVVHAVDLSAKALEVARNNACRLGLTSRVVLHQGDLLEPLARDRPWLDMVVSNPPYVSAEDWEQLEPEVRDHEPRMALVAEPDRDTLYARLARESAQRLLPGGHLLVEIGHDMAQQAREAVSRSGLEVLRVLPDLQGHPRTLVARQAGPGPAPR